MSDATTPRGPLFPPRDGPSLIDTPPPPPPPVTSSRAEQPAINLVLASQIERTVMEVFIKRYGQNTMPFVQARDLTYLERELISTLVTTLAKRADAP